MSAFLMRAAIASTRGWVGLYTRRLPTDLAEMRRAEIESDIWELQHDPGLVTSRASGWTVLLRLIKGIPDDIGWHLENASSEEQVMTRRAVSLAAATVLVLSLWSVPSFNRRLDVAPCSGALPQVAASLQLEVIKCVGSLFGGQAPWRILR